MIILTEEARNRIVRYIRKPTEEELSRRKEFMEKVNSRIANRELNIKIDNNKNTLEDLFKNKNIDPNSKVGLELLEIYNNTQDKLKIELEELKTQVVDIATNDFNSL